MWSRMEEDVFQAASVLWQRFEKLTFIMNEIMKILPFQAGR